jgi:hypothetical protein
MSRGKFVIDEQRKVLIETHVQILRERILRELRHCESEGHRKTVGRMIIMLNYVIGLAPVWWQLLKMRDEGLLAFDGEPNCIKLEAEIRLV